MIWEKKSKGFLYIEKFFVCLLLSFIKWKAAMESIQAGNELKSAQRRWMIRRVCAAVPTRSISWRIPCVTHTSFLYSAVSGSFQQAQRLIEWDANCSIA